MSLLLLLIQIVLLFFVNVTLAIERAMEGGGCWGAGGRMILSNTTRDVFICRHEPILGPVCRRRGTRAYGPISSIAGSEGKGRGEEIAGCHALNNAHKK